MENRWTMMNIDESAPMGDQRASPSQKQNAGHLIQSHGHAAMWSQVLPVWPPTMATLEQGHEKNQFDVAKLYIYIYMISNIYLVLSTLGHLDFSKNKLQKGQLQDQVLLTAKLKWHQWKVKARPTSTHGQPHYYLQVRLSQDTRAAHPSKRPPKAPKPL